MWLLAVLAAFGVIKAGLAIYRGDKAKIEDHPWNVIVEVAGGYGKAGAIISDRLVVTAATAVYQQNIITIRAGSSILGEGGSKHSVNETFIYPGFPAHRIFSNNIALIRVNEPFEFGATRKPVKLFEQGHVISYGTKANVSGWGDTESPDFNKQLYSLEVEVVDPNAYSNMYCKPGLLCAKNGDKEESIRYVCNNDMGDPLVVDYGNDKYLAGIMSDTICSGTGPSGYTKVPFFRNWIDKYLGGKSSKIESNDIPL